MRGSQIAIATILLCTLESVIYVIFGKAHEKNVMSNCVFEIKQYNILGFASHFVMPLFLPELILFVLSDVKHQYKF